MLKALESDMSVAARRVAMQRDLRDMEANTALKGERDEYRQDLEPGKETASGHGSQATRNVDGFPRREGIHRSTSETASRSD